MNEKLFLMPELEMCEYEVDEIMAVTNPEPDVNSEIEYGGIDYI